MDTTQLLIIAAAALGFLLIMQATRRNWRRSHARTEPPARERYQELQRSASASRDLEQVMIELDQLARQIHGKLDTRFAKLETIIRDADERIDRLSRLVRESRGERSLDVTIDDDALLPTMASSNSGSPPRSAPPVPGSTPEQTVSIPQAALTSRGQQQRETIYKLSDEGLEPVAIAQRVGRTTGEVELILSLRKAAAHSAALAAGPT